MVQLNRSLNLSLFMKRCFCLLLCTLFCLTQIWGQKSPFTQISSSNVGEAWASNSINTVVFRKNALVSFGQFQFIAYYNQDGFVVLGKRKLSDSLWQLHTTKYKGHIKDAHNSISIAIDGDGFLHMAFDHHVNQLHYCKSKEPLSMELTELMPMVGDLENKVTYPEFYALSTGDLLFLYRDGASGNGNLVLNTYQTKTKQWRRLQTNLIDGQGQRNAYWQACTDQLGRMHISWVWRESPDVASNHDMNYAVSKDGGVTWQKSNGEPYKLPINISNAEKIATIAPASELMNQTSMCVDETAHPIIATYWKGIYGVPQYQIIYLQNSKWQVKDLGILKTKFSLSGAGTKSIPISRPQVVSWGKGNKTAVGIVFRDNARGVGASFAYSYLQPKAPVQVLDLYAQNLGAWEPTLDIELWKHDKNLNLFLQQVQQVDGEGLQLIAPQMIRVWEGSVNY